MDNDGFFLLQKEEKILSPSKQQLNVTLSAAINQLRHMTILIVYCSEDDISRTWELIPS